MGNDNFSNLLQLKNFKIFEILFDHATLGNELVEKIQNYDISLLKLSKFVTFLYILFTFFLCRGNKSRQNFSVLENLVWRFYP